MRRRSKQPSRLTRVKRRQAVRAVVISIALIGFILFAIVRFGIPLLIQLALAVSSISGTQSSQEALPVIIPAPVLDALPEATPSASIAVTGFAPPNLTVSVLVDGQVSTQTTASPDGTFDVQLKLHPGDNTVSAIAQDEQGNRSAKSIDWTVSRDDQPPSLTISTPADRAAFQGESQKTIEIVGKTDIDATIMVGNRIAVVSPDGSFSVRFTLSDGENHLVITARDPAGNQTLQELTVVWHG